MRLILLALLSTLLLSASDIANFAKEMQYETVYDVAKARAIKEKKTYHVGDGDTLLSMVS